MRLSKAFAAVTAGAALVLGSVAVNADGAAEVDAAAGNSAKQLGIANFGLDPVSLTEQGRRTVGLAKYSAIHDAAIYRFASASNLKKFQARPDRYKRPPGGHCAYGVVVGAKFFGDPRCFKSVNGRRAPDLDEDSQETSPEGARDLIDATTKNWTQITHKDPSDLG